MHLTKKQIIYKRKCKVNLFQFPRRLAKRKTDINLYPKEKEEKEKLLVFLHDLTAWEEIECTLIT